MISNFSSCFFSVIPVIRGDDQFTFLRQDTQWIQSQLKLICGHFRESLFEVLTIMLLKVYPSPHYVIVIRHYKGIYLINLTFTPSHGINLFIVLLINCISLLIVYIYVQKLWFLIYVLNMMMVTLMFLIVNKLVIWSNHWLLSLARPDQASPYSIVLHAYVHNMHISDTLNFTPLYSTTCIAEDKSRAGTL